MAKHRGSFSKSVFVNCPFDSDYVPLLRPLLFTIVYAGFTLRIASESSDSFQNRIDKIVECIRASKYSVHDLSRLRSTAAGDVARMNMPFELGVDYGARRFGPSLHGKKCLILSETAYDYRRALSDFSGVDIKFHAGEPEEVVRAMRNWFVETVGLKGFESGRTIWYRFAAFVTDFRDARKAEGFADRDLDMMPVPEYIDFMTEWTRQQRDG